MDERTMSRFLEAAAGGDPYALQKVNQMREAIGRGEMIHPAEMTRQPPAPREVIPIHQDQIHPPKAGNFVHPIMAPTRILNMEGIESVPAGQVSAGAARMEFDAGPGWLIGFRGSVIDYSEGAQAAGEFERANMGLRLFFNGGEEIITNGTRASFARYSDLFPTASVWSPILRWCYATDDLFAEFQNFNPDGGPDLQATLMFLYWREKYPGT